jgi:hypothetical protein
MAYLEPYSSWPGDRTDGLFRLEIRYRTSIHATQPRIIRLTFLPTTPVLVLRQELQRITQIPIEAQHLTITYPARFPTLLELLENRHTLQQVGLRAFSTLTLEKEMRVDFDGIGAALVAFLKVVLIVKCVVSAVVLFRVWSERGGV